MPELRTSPRPRATASLNSKLEKHLGSYAAAASAAGLAFFAPARTNATIVYTATNIAVTDDLYIDVDGNGLADFRFAFDGGLHGSALVVHPAVRGNGVACNVVYSNCPFAAAGHYGRAIGPLGVFISNTLASTSGFGGAGVLMANAGTYAATVYFDGPWANTVNRYLGLKFFIGNHVHYGWARLSVHNWRLGGAITLTGYAYETVANTRILAGHETGPVALETEPAAPSANAAALGALARGSNGLAIWRRETQ
jgi:hypothetical protein